MCEIYSDVYIFSISQELPSPLESPTTIKATDPTNANQDFKTDWFFRSVFYLAR